MILYSSLLILICIALPFAFFKFKRENRVPTVLYYVSLAFHIAVAIIFSYNLYSIPGADKDPMRFYNFGKRIAESGVFQKNWYGSTLYDNILGWFFHITTPSVLLGSLTSVLAFSLCFLALFRIVKTLGLEKPNVHYCALTFLYALLPATLCFTAVTLRESWQILCVTMSLLFYLTAVQRRQYRYALLALPFLFGLTMLHNGLYIYAMLSPLLLIIIPQPKTRYLLLVILTMVLSIYSFPKLLYDIDAKAFKPTPIMRQIDKGDLSIAQYTQRYRKSIDHGRSRYSVHLNKSSLKGFIRSSNAIVISYMFRPFPHEIKQPKDLYAFAEVLLRIILIVLFLWGWLFMTREKKFLTVFLGMHYTLLMFLWASGTASWGTALRHHTTHQFILVILGTMGAVSLYTHFTQQRCQSPVAIDGQ